MCSSGSQGGISVTESVSAPAARAAGDVSSLNALKVLLRADVTAQLRSYRSLLLTIVLPLFVLLFTSIRGKSAQRLGGPYVVLELALTVGLVSIGAIGYSTSVARDRDKGILQRLRVTPAPAWTIMASRWIVQVGAVFVMAIVVLVAADIVEGVTLSAAGYVSTVIVALLGSAVFLGIGQAIVALIPSADTLNAAGRLLYLPLIGLSLFGQTDLLGTTFEMVSRWSPGGCLETLLSVSTGASSWAEETWGAVLASVAYIVVFGGVGVRYFRWTGK
jgi:ABC-2 type transport system permease protein